MSERPQFGGVPFDEFLLVGSSLVEVAGLAVPVERLGVGKTVAAVTLSSRLRQCAGARGVLLLGFAGAFPERHRREPPPVRHGAACVVGSDRFGDEGVETPTGFQDLAALGLGDCGPFPANPRIAQQAAERLGAPIVRGVTVSTCSGTEQTSRRMATRSGADVETMEGAAVAWVCRQFELPLLHVRAISNWTGDRERGAWDLAAAHQALAQAVRRLAGRD